MKKETKFVLRSAKLRTIQAASCTVQHSTYESKMKKVLPSFRMGEHFQPIVDSNEGNRVLFPSTMQWWPYRNPPVLITIAKPLFKNLGRLHLSRGDITLQGYTHVVAFERKGSMAELLKDYKSGKLERQLYNLQRLVKYPYLLLDIPMPNMYGTGRNTGFRDGDVTPCILDPILFLLNKMGYPPPIGPVTATTNATRKALGEYLMRIMLSRITEKGTQYVPYEQIQNYHKHKDRSRTPPPQ